MNEYDTINLLRASSHSTWDTSGLPTRAALFGDGIFETMIFVEGKIRFAPAHQNRVNQGLKALKLNATGMADVLEIEKVIGEKVDGSRSWRIRWNIFRSGQGKYTPEKNHCTEQLMIQPFTASSTIKKNAYFSTTVHLYPSPWSHCKTLNCLPYVMANLERRDKNMDEVILTDADGYLSEAGASNLFWIKDGTVYTPSLSHHAISGVGRSQIIQMFNDKKIPFQEGSYTKEHLLEADQVFTSNVTGISYIQEIENRNFSTEAIPSIEVIFQSPT